MQVHPFAALVQPDGHRVYAALHHHVCHLTVSARTAPAVLWEGTITHCIDIYIIL